LYDLCRKIRQQKSMGFEVSSFDNKVLKFGADFEKNMMDLKINIPLVEQLNLGWKILQDHFLPDETALPSKLIDKYWKYDIK
jgi:V/A-type H+-transporting ATPase subunit B